MRPLLPNTVYHHMGNAFSQAFFVYENFLESKRCVIFDADDELRRFKKLYTAISGSAPQIISSPADLAHLVYATSGVFCLTREIFDGRVIDLYQHMKHTITLRAWQSMSQHDFVESLIAAGYNFDRGLDAAGTYKAEWDAVTVRTFYDDRVLTVGFFGNEIDDIFQFDSCTGELRTRLSEVAFPPFLPSLPLVDIGQKSWSEFFPETVVFFSWLDFFDQKAKLLSQLPRWVDFSLAAKSGVSLDVQDVDIASLDELKNILSDKKNHVTVYTKNKKSLEHFCEYNDLSVPEICEVGNIGAESFVYADGSLMRYVIADDVLGNVFVKRRYRRTLTKNLDLLLQIRPGDYVVHVDHGVGIFRQMLVKELSGVQREYVEIEYRENDKLFVPVSELHRLSKYIGDEHPKLTRLDSTEWSRVMKAAEADVERIAAELLDIYAHRSLAKGFAFLPFPKQEHLFRQAFAHTHTADQEQAISEILADMSEGTPMDRLLSGDVGFGKTEVAMNAIYRAFLNHKQTILISPLVVLAIEHFESLAKRLEPFGVNVAVLSRVSTKKEEKYVLEGLKDGTIHCVVGTHRLLSPDVEFARLGLLVIDEEHKFGVLDKEKLTALKSNLDILSLSATPIPRSLNLALNGVRKISILATPPPLKKAIKTTAIKFDYAYIRQAIEFELERDGQVLFIHNRIATLETLKKDLEELLGKKIRIAITHGQMDGAAMEDRILDFKYGKYDILLSTTVIENGVNFLRANTIFIDDAGSFGLSQLHQLRGRVGRKDVEGHCYLLYRKEVLADDAKKRIVTIVNHAHLGAGFEIAMRDLEIRGAGDILGIKQSGKSKETGLSLYLQLLEQKIESLKSGQSRQIPDCKVELDLSYYVSDDFFASEVDKIAFFRNLESIDTEEDLDYTYETFREWNDELPEAVENLFLVLKMRIRMRKYGVVLVKKMMTNYFFEFDKHVDVAQLRRFLELDRGGDFVVVTAHKIRVETRHWKDAKEFLRGILATSDWLWREKR